jgi:hypothetical protein
MGLHRTTPDQSQDALAVSCAGWRSAACDEADEEAQPERAEHAFGGVLTDVILGGDMQFAGFDTRVFPLAGRGFLEVMGLFRGNGLEGGGPFGGGLAELRSLSSPALASAACTNSRAFSLAAARRSLAAWPMDGVWVKPASGSRLSGVENGFDMALIRFRHNLHGNVATDD